jgi:AP-1-like transcription factor
MASTSTNSGLPPNFFLTPQQQNLLFAALNSNRQQKQSPPASNALSLSPTSFTTSPAQPDSISESPYLDNYDYDFDPDSSFDFDFAGNGQAKMIGDLPGTAPSESTENESHDKRSHPDDEEDDDADSPGGNGKGNGNSAKRRESTEKVAKKPGRKPLTTEPSSVSSPVRRVISKTELTVFALQKRKAQNRAAQRAFRERKEKHLKDLETKVEELEKASEATNHENGLLRAQVERITTELNEYKQKVSLMTNPRTMPPQKHLGGFGPAAVNNLSDVNFQFEFPKFGMLPGGLANKNVRLSASLSPPSLGMDSSPISPSNQGSTRSSLSQRVESPLDTQGKDDLAKFSGIFSPPLTTNIVTNASRASLDSGHFSAGPTATSSPSASSNSNMGPSSSCGTSPEPFTQSPKGFKPVDTMTTIGEEQPSLTSGGQGEIRLTI